MTKANGRFIQKYSRPTSTLCRRQPHHTVALYRRCLYGNERYVYTKDHLGSIRDIVKLDGTLVQRNRYSAYGIIAQELAEVRPDAKLISNRFGYTGRELDGETGLYYYRARYYSPESGRFISPDTIGFNSGQVAMYGYVNNNPVNLTDPSGRCPICIVGGIIGTGAFVGGLSNAIGSAISGGDFRDVGKSFIVGAIAGARATSTALGAAFGAAPTAITVTAAIVVDLSIQAAFAVYSMPSGTGLEEVSAATKGPDSIKKADEIRDNPSFCK